MGHLDYCRLWVVGIPLIVAASIGQKNKELQMKRRQFTNVLTAAAALPGLAAWPVDARKFWGNNQNALSSKLKTLERESGGRLGVAILDTGNGERYGWRAEERFPMCSTFKLLAAGLVLQRVDADKERLDRHVAFSQADLVAYSPATEAQAGTGMRMAELCEGAITLSDNTAANLMLASFGGPPALTAFVRSLGDSRTRLDRIEPELNEATPGDPRDTTTPGSMTECIQQIVLGKALSESSREQMRRWLLATKTSDRRLRALTPPGWQIGDKTGSGAHGSTNDVGVLWPPGKSPIVVSVYLTGTSRPATERDAIIARAGQLAASLR